MKIGLLGCKGTTLDLLHGIRSEGAIDLDVVITLPEDVARRNQVAYFRGHDIAGYCRDGGIALHTVTSYDLKQPEDEALFREAGLDLLLVIGWERLLPPPVLNSLGKFACGMHGSAFGLPRGRGRSPLNWSILTEQTKFVTYLFRYNSGVDAGDIVGFKVFEVNQFDSIATLHMKNRIAMQQLVTMYVPLIERDEAVYWPQPPGKPTFYPRRRPEDSCIDWSQSTQKVYNLIRAVAAPYPPAYCFRGDDKLFIIEAFPFESGLFDQRIPPGTIVDISISLGQFVVKTADGSLLVERYEGIAPCDLRLGDVLTGGSQVDVLAEITQRYPPDLPDDEKEILPAAHPTDGAAL